MKAEHIAELFSGLTHDSKGLLAKKHSKLLTAAIMQVNGDITRANPTNPLSVLTPPVKLIFEAVRQCPLEIAEIVIIGQDPYIKPGEAQGLCFSVPRGVTVPPSLKNIYKCLLHNKNINKIPQHGDLTGWARQRILLLNAALTTRVGTSNAHAEAWSEYTDAIIKELSANQRPIIFVLFGGFAQEKRPLIDARRHIIFEWGHPSNLNRANGEENNPKNFKYCTVFSRINDQLSLWGRQVINWDPDSPPTTTTPLGLLQVGPPTIAVVNGPSIERTIITRETPLIPKETLDAGYVAGPQSPIKLRDLSDNDPIPYTHDVIWIFTDGGSKGNGSTHCVSSYGWYITDGEKVASDCGLVPAEECKSSNNRGELTAILNSLIFISNNCDSFDTTNINVVSDSEYSINSITNWIYNWEKDPVKHAEKKNLDLIKPAKALVEGLKKSRTVKFLHINSHRPEPQDNDTEEWFMWKCNDMVDQMCNRVLGRK